jgi:uncharacterized membrane protein
MGEIIENKPQRDGDGDATELKTITTVVYALQALSFIFGITAIVAIIINYVKREDVKGTLYENHFDWQISTFWWGLLWFALGWITAWFLIGFVVLFVVWIWIIYRVVKGWLKLSEGKPVRAA